MTRGEPRSPSSRQAPVIHQRPRTRHRATESPMGRRPSGWNSRSGNERPQCGRTLYAFSHPDFTVGSGVSPDRALVLPLALAGSTAGQDLIVIARRPHQSPKALYGFTVRNWWVFVKSARPRHMDGRDRYTPRASLTRSKNPRPFGCCVTSLPRLDANRSNSSR